MFRAMQTNRALRAGTLIFLLCLLGAAAMAQTPNGVITARAYDNFAPNSVVAVAPRDDTDLNLRLAREFERALTDAGYRQGEPADLILAFETEYQSGAAGQPLVDVFGRYGSEGGARDFGARIRLPAARRSADRGGDRFRMSVELHPADGAAVWAAVASTTQPRLDRFRAGRAMAEELVTVLGETVDDRPVRLD